MQMYYSFPQIQPCVLKIPKEKPNE